ncbi:hypothetical protein P7K49_034284 [Saguinus oedipus]|uniref:Uncharacterized protein n=1 Tax=Saguinus oedipus TaxID=9490 RepID=A0ABQ9TUB2_SAGOE|nr:hypothetical protein P7K49_034284 [Saguinus oedipus]
MRWADLLALGALRCSPQSSRGVSRLWLFPESGQVPACAASGQTRWQRPGLCGAAGGLEGRRGVSVAQRATFPRALRPPRRPDPGPALVTVTGGEAGSKCSPGLTLCAPSRVCTLALQRRQVSAGDRGAGPGLSRSRTFVLSHALVGRAGRGPRSSDPLAAAAHIAAWTLGWFLAWPESDPGVGWGRQDPGFSAPATLWLGGLFLRLALDPVGGSQKGAPLR